MVELDGDNRESQSPIGDLSTASTTRNVDAAADPDVDSQITETQITETQITDSPWFWAYLFGTAGLIALFLAGPRYVDRQPQIERQFLARQNGGQAIKAADGPVAPSTSRKMIITLWPLYGTCVLILVLAWVGLWYQRFRLRR